jgi:pimeloyl-ACP methyl ester carboxylesterase
MLEAALPGARVATPDLPGCGSLNERRSPANVEAMVEAYRELLRERALGTPFHLFGLSLGAMVAAAWAARHPEEIAACVLVNGSMRPWCRWHERLNPRHALGLASVALGVGSRRWRESMVLGITSAAPDLHAGLPEQWARMRRENPVSAANALRQLAAAARFHAPRVPPRAPVLVLCAGRDTLVDPRCSMRLAAEWNAALAVHPTAGHDLPLDDGPWVAARVRDWSDGLRR